MTTIVPRPALDPADWRLSSLAIHQPTDLSTWSRTVAWIGAADVPGTRIEAELIPLTPKAISMVPLLPGHRFICQGQLFEVTGGYVTHNSEPPVVVVSITCEQNYGYWIYEDNAVPERSRLEWPDSWIPAHALPLPAGEVQP